MNRRGFLFGLGSLLVAAPAVVQASALMPIRGLVMPIAPKRVMADLSVLLEQPFDLRPGAIMRVLHPNDFKTLDDWPPDSREAADEAVRRYLREQGPGARIVSDECAAHIRYDVTGHPLQLYRTVVVESWKA